MRVVGRVKTHLAWRWWQAKQLPLERYARVRRTIGDGIALTFDDGPDPVHTPAVLDVLAEHGAVATFFVVGDAAAAHPDLLERMVAEGHAVGSHSRTHEDLWTLDAAGVDAEVADGHRAVEAVLGRRTALFRPPKGHLDWNVARSSRRARLVPWLWSQTPADWEPDVTADQICERLPSLRSGDVVLLHDGIEKPVAESARDRSATVEALPRIIAAARTQGLAFRTLDQVA